MFVITTLDRVDYQDLFLTPVGPPGALTAEQWARRVLEGPTARTRAQLVAGWLSLGLDVRPWRAGTVLGWEVRERSPQRLLVGVGGRLGIRGELAFERVEEGWRFDTFVQTDGPLARALWARIVPTHVRTVPSLLGRAARGLG